MDEEGPAGTPARPRSGLPGVYWICIFVHGDDCVCIIGGPLEIMQMLALVLNGPNVIYRHRRAGTQGVSSFQCGLR